MCIVSIAWQAHPDWQLIALGNRDEMHARPSAAAKHWADAPHVIAGRDEVAGGTWMGVSTEGRFGVITNVADFGNPDPTKASRGDLLRDFLSGSDSGQSDNADYNPYNLFTASAGEAAIKTNRPEHWEQIAEPGIYGLSNGTLDNPWPKSGALNERLRNWLAGKADQPEQMLDWLRDENGFSENSVNMEREPHHSPLFIRNPVYGTRCSTLVAVDQQGQGLFVERRFTSGGEPEGESFFDFAWLAS